MIAIPAIDLREGACVQLVGGEYDAERVRIPDPLEQARQFRDLGFSWLHVVDLDRATERGDNDEVVRKLLGVDGVSIQVGGGIRIPQQIEHLIEAGASRVVVGTKAIYDQGFRCEIAAAFPDRVVLALDVREREVVSHGWKRRSGIDVIDLVSECAGLALAALLITAVHKEGALGGTDVELYRQVTTVAETAVIASGGVTTLEDLRALQAVGVAASVVGMAIYTGGLDLAGLAKEYGR